MQINPPVKFFNYLVKLSEMKLFNITFTMLLSISCTMLVQGQGYILLNELPYPNAGSN